MENDAVRETRRLLEDAIQESLTEETLKKAKKRLNDMLSSLESDFEYSLQADLAYNLAGWTYRMFEQAIEALLKGDDNTMRRYLSCQEGQYTGRDREHPVIHGKLFETGAIELRKKIVEAHAELIKNQRI